VSHEDLQALYRVSQCVLADLGPLSKPGYDFIGESGADDGEKYLNARQREELAVLAKKQLAEASKARKTFSGRKSESHKRTREPFFKTQHGDIEVCYQDSFWN
jgi:hypothetical protein